jgi:hypothetical protein
MPIISSVPALNAIVKGVGATFTLDKAELLLVPSVAGSPYYSDETNWQSVILNYVSSTGNQSESVLFDATQVTPTALFDVATSALDIFLIESITIMDFQFGTLRVPRSELTVVDFDVDMTPAPSYATFSPTLKEAMFSLSNADMTIAKDNGVAPASFIWGFFNNFIDVSLDQKMYLEFLVGAGSNYKFAIGADFGNGTPSSPFYSNTSGVDTTVGGFINNSGDGALQVFTGATPVPNGVSIPVWNSGAVVMMAIDALNNKVWIGVDGTWADGNPATNTGGFNFTVSLSSYTRIYPKVAMFCSLAIQPDTLTKVAIPAYLPSGYTSF